MKSICRRVVWALVVILAVSVMAFAQSAIEFSGFGDILYVNYQDEDEESGFEFGQVELDLAAEIDENVSVEAAIAFDPDAEAFGSGAFLIDFHLFGSEGSHFRPVEGIDVLPARW